MTAFRALSGGEEMVLQPNASSGVFRGIDGDDYAGFKAVGMELRRWHKRLGAFIDLVGHPVLLPVGTTPGAGDVVFLSMSDAFYPTSGKRKAHAQRNLGEQRPAWYWDWIRPHRDGVTGSGTPLSSKEGVSLQEKIVDDVLANSWHSRFLMKGT
eukprot:CAMPEP_0185816266 /NCGR_PEP_ID=MMETSP1322-20130828/17162_1 /TAXON_ID=265543 /ORGANISM="Minutocellus polymorphus, Strain RCC2270" /LENGTH=153 /DNA_ID=CAMNT_0028513193 /DNA_START=103 /DNA_END=560 /DNA_ORIENTATION=+